MRISQAFCLEHINRLAFARDLKGKGSVARLACFAADRVEVSSLDLGARKSRCNLGRGAGGRRPGNSHKTAQFLSFSSESSICRQFVES